MILFSFPNSPATQWPEQGKCIAALPQAYKGIQIITKIAWICIRGSIHRAGAGLCKNSLASMGQGAGKRHFLMLGAVGHSQDEQGPWTPLVLICWVSCVLWGHLRGEERYQNMGNALLMWFFCCFSTHTLVELLGRELSGLIPPLLGERIGFGVFLFSFQHFPSTVGVIQHKSLPT